MSIQLFKHEIEYNINLIRDAMRMHEQRMHDPVDGTYHKAMYRNAIHLLEIINPKHTNPQ